jgi:hypothetical protein
MFKTHSFSILEIIYKWWGCHIYVSLQEGHQYMWRPFSSPLTPSTKSVTNIQPPVRTPLNCPTSIWIPVEKKSTMKNKTYYLNTSHANTLYIYIHTRNNMRAETNETLQVPFAGWTNTEGDAKSPGLFLQCQKPLESPYCWLMMITPQDITVTYNPQNHQPSINSGCYHHVCGICWLKGRNISKKHK